MNKIVSGLHHITALASDPQRNLDFYAGILGLRLIKKTINFDSPEIYHLYYGNEEGAPGTILTFFPYQNIPKGRKGKGQLTVSSFSISEKAVDYWIKRLEKFNIVYKAPEHRLDELFIYFEDYDGLGLELVANNRDERLGFTYGNVPCEFAIKGFYGMTLSEESYEQTAELLTGHMNHTLVAEVGNRLRFSASEKTAGFVDIICTPETLKGLGGYGTVHHVAFATATDKTQLEIREKLLQHHFNVTPVIDRQYFHSIYFREPGGVLFEVATVFPGFTVDESLEHLGELLKLPTWQEKNRNFLEKKLAPIQLNIEKFAD